VIATDVGGVRDLLAEPSEANDAITHGGFQVVQRGVLVQAGDAEGLAAAMGRLAHDAALRQRLGAAGRAHALRTFAAERLLEASKNASYMSLYNQIFRQYDEYMNDRTPSSQIGPPDGLKWSSPVAYFSTEYGLHDSLPIYSGGLGTLAGDHLKTASDLNIPLVGIGLLYKHGFFRQVIDKNGAQTEEYPENDFSRMPLQIVQDDRGDTVQISLELPGRTLFANIWEVQVGRVPLYLLDTDVPRNTPQDRKITERLYCAEPRTRIEQEILLGMGGVRVLKKLGIRPRVYHINEGHSAFLLFERIDELMTEEGLSFDEASEIVRGSTVFTTHTPVEAGNERFSKELIEHYFTNFVKRTGISWSQFWELGRKESGEGKPFFMTMWLSSTLETVFPSP